MGSEYQLAKQIMRELRPNELEQFEKTWPTVHQSVTRSQGQSALQKPAGEYVGPKAFMGPEMVLGLAWPVTVSVSSMVVCELLRRLARKGFAARLSDQVIEGVSVKEHIIDISTKFQIDETEARKLVNVIVKHIDEHPELYKREDRSAKPRTSK